DLEDPRVRRLAAHSGALAARPLGRAARHGLVGAARGAGVVALELRAADTPGDEAACARALEGAAVAVLVALGVLPPEAAAREAPPPDAAGLTIPPVAPRAQPDPPPAVARPVRVRAPAGGLIEAAVSPGSVVRAGATLARLAPTLPGRAMAVTAPVDAL